MTRFEALLKIAGGDEADIPGVDEQRDFPVDGEGPLTATLVVVGESLGFEEVETRRPFQGRSGQKLRNHARLAGVDLRQARIENVMPLFPPGGSITNVGGETLTRWQEDCCQRVRALSQAQLLVVVGNVALETFTGLRDITRRRGSVYEWEGKKVLPMIHPAMVLRRPQYEKHCRLDWERVKLLMTPHQEHNWYCGCARRRERRHITPYTADTGTFQKAFLRYCQEEAENPQAICAIDIETPQVDGRRRILCVSFAFSAEESLVIPWGETYSMRIRRLCESPCIKLGHNFISFDRWWLQREGIEVRGKIIDTLCLSHALDPASVHSLEFLTSRYTWEPWYKDEGKGHDIALIEKDLAGYYAYCGLDSCVTRELYDILWPQLEARGLVPFYRKHYETLYDPILDLSTRGVRIDHVARRGFLLQNLASAREARDMLGNLAGKPLFTLGAKRDQAIYHALGDDTALRALEVQYGKEAVAISIDRLTSKTVSNAQLKELLYEHLGLPVQLKRRSGGDYTATADAVTLRKLRLEYGESQPEVRQILDLALQHNKAQKLASFCYENHFDEDGRFRFSLKVNTEAARLSSSAAPNGRGQNSQNAPRDKRYRRIFLPESGHVLLEVDGSAVEGRLGFVHTGDEDLIRMARLRSSIFDQHKYVASLVFEKPEGSITRNERQVAKSLNHGAMRDMQAERMAETLLRDDFVLSVEECETRIDRYHKAFPAIRQWHQKVRQEVRQNKRLINAFGRMWSVEYEEVNAELFRRAYSWLLQSECADWMNTMGFIPLWQYLQEKAQSRILLHEHDGLVLSCDVGEVYDIATFLRDHLEAERAFGTVTLQVPIEYKLGVSWGETEEFKELPSREVFEAKVKEMLTS